MAKTINNSNGVKTVELKKYIHGHVEVKELEDGNFMIQDREDDRDIILSRTQLDSVKKILDIMCE